MTLKNSIQLCPILLTLRQRPVVVHLLANGTVELAHYLKKQGKKDQYQKLLYLAAKSHLYFKEPEAFQKLYEEIQQHSKNIPITWELLHAKNCIFIKEYNKALISLQKVLSTLKENPNNVYEATELLYQLQAANTNIDNNIITQEINKAETFLLPKVGKQYDIINKVILNLLPHLTRLALHNFNDELLPLIKQVNKWVNKHCPPFAKQLQAIKKIKYTQEENNDPTETLVNDFIKNNDLEVKTLMIMFALIEEYQNPEHTSKENIFKKIVLTLALYTKIHTDKKKGITRRPSTSKFCFNHIIYRHSHRSNKN